MDNNITIPYRIQSNVALALLAKLTQDKPSQQAEFDKFLEVLPSSISDYLSERVMQYDLNTDLTKLTGSLSPENRFMLHTAAEALEPQSPIEWVVERLFAKGSVAMVVGDPGSKKTYSMIDLAVCVAMGIPWLGFSTKKAPLLLIDEESGLRRINQRLGDVMRGHGADGSIPIHYVSLARFNLRSQSGRICNSTDLSILEEKIQETRAEMVIIDALADIMPGADENAVKDVQPIFMGLRQVADDTQSAIIVIHHANKGGDYRGSSAILGALDIMVRVQSEPDSPNIDYKVTKHRDGKPENFAGVANFGVENFTLSSSQFTRRNELSKSQLYVLLYLMKNGNSSISHITSHADKCSDASARKAVYSLANLGLVYRTDGGGSGKEAIYGLSDVGKEKSAVLM